MSGESKSNLFISSKDMHRVNEDLKYLLIYGSMWAEEYTVQPTVTYCIQQFSHYAVRDLGQALLKENKVIIKTKLTDQIK